MNEEEWSNIEKVPVYTEKELANEFEAFTVVLNGTAADWNKRLKALKRLQGLIIGGAYHIGNFPTLMTKLYVHISSQLNDLRSAISKEACTLVCMAAKLGGESLETFCDKIVSKECLLKLVNSANKITAEQGHACIIALLEEVKSYRIVPKIIDELSSKNASLRVKIAEYLYIILRSYDQSIIEKYQMIIEGAITGAIGDANKDVRLIMRKSFQIYNELYPARADRMFANYDSSVQKALMEDGVVENKALSPKKKPYANMLLSQPSKGNQRPASAMSGKVGNKKEEVHNERPENAKTFSTAYTYSSEKFDALDITKKMLKTAGSAKLGSSSKLSDASPKIRGSDVIASRNRTRDARAENNKTPDASPKIAKIRSFQTIDNNQNTNSMQFSSKIGAGGRRSPSPRKSPSPMAKLSPRTRETMTEASQLFTTESSILKKPGYDYYQTIKDDDLKFLLEKTNDDNWATRSNSFEKVNEYITELKSDEEVSTSLMNMLIIAHIQHLNDAHYKVIVACQDSFSRLLTTYSPKVLPFLDKVIPLLFMNLIDGKDKVSASTNFLLNLINKIYQGDELFPSFLKALDFSNKPTYKQSILEFMNVLAPRCNNYFGSVQSMKTCVTKVATLMSEFNSQKRILPACYSLINYMRDLDAEITIGALASLKAFMLSTVLSICSEYSPDIEREVKTYKALVRERPKTPEVSSSPVRNSTKPKATFTNNYKLNNTVSIDSPKKVNYSFLNNESRSPSSLLDNSEVNTSSVSYAANYTSETRKMASPNRLSKNLKHTASNPNLTHSSSHSQLVKPKASPMKQQHSPAKVHTFLKSKTVVVSNENPKAKLMKFDFDDEDENHQNDDYDLDESVKKSIQIIEIEESRKSEYSPKPSLTSISTIKSTIKPPKEERAEYMSKPSTATSISTNVNKSVATVSRPATVKEEKPDLNSLEGIKKVIDQYPRTRDLIEDKISHIISTIFEKTSKTDLAVMEMALTTLNKLLNMKINLQENSEELLSGIASFYHAPPKAYGAIDTIFKSSLSLSEPEDNLNILLRILAREDHPVIQLIIKQITNIFLKNINQELKPYLAALFEIYKEIINHNNPDVRKNVVFSIVDLHFMYKVQIEKFIQEFSPSHQKLIEIYIQKRSEKQSGKA